MLRSTRRLLRLFVCREQTTRLSLHISHVRFLATISSSTLDNATPTTTTTSTSAREEDQSGRKTARLFHRGRAPPMEETIGELLKSAAGAWPNRECIVSLHQNVRITFSEVLRRADRLAAGLRKLGLKRGDRIGIWGPNDVEWYIACMSAMRAGFIVVAMNPAYRLGELLHSLQNVETKAVITPGKFKTQDYTGMLLESKISCPSLQHIIVYSQDPVAGTRSFTELEDLANAREVEEIAAEQTEISPYDGCNMQFTSGTTGKPKATLLSHRSLWNNSKQGVERAEIAVGEKICLNVPFFHAFGLTMGQLGTLHAGSTLVLPSPTFEPVKSIEAMARERCTVSYGTPTMWVNMIDAQERLQAPLEKLHVGMLGGSPAPPELFKRISQCFRFDNLQSIYGLTETTAIAFQTLPGDSIETRHTTVGHLSDNVEAMVVDENGSAIPFDSPGELWIRGYNTMIKYWNNDEQTRKVLTASGWLKTGDLFILRADGYGRVIGRLKDMLIRGGENIYPREIEDFLITHPQVIEAQVIGAYDQVYGEEICACVRLRDNANITEKALRDYCKGKIAHFKIPRYIQFVEEYPKTTSGKVQKFLLKQEMERISVIPSPPK